MAAITSSSQKYERKNVGRRLQIRGFPKIWAEELTFDEIAVNEIIFHFKIIKFSVVVV